MSKKLTEGLAFTPDSVPGKALRRPMSGAELLTIVALTASTVVAATAVSIGIARASALEAVADHGTPIAVVLIVGFTLAAMVALTTMAARGRSERR